MSETAVAYGWWVWITALMSGRSRKICRIAGVSDEGLRVPSMTLPSISMTIISSSTIFSYIMPDGVTRISPVGMRTLRLPQVSDTSS